MSRRASRPSRARSLPAACPCGLSPSYEDCCGSVHRGERPAGSPEELMRSRYAAFAVRDEGYLLRSWHPDTRPADVSCDPGLRWVGLEILGTTGGSAFHSEGTVEFRARCVERGEPGELHEISRFTRHGDAWVYVDGVIQG